MASEAYPSSSPMPFWSAPSLRFLGMPVDSPTGHLTCCYLRSGCRVLKQKSVLKAADGRSESDREIPL